MTDGGRRRAGADLTPFRRLLLAAFGLGFSPVAPGTAGSLGTALVVFLAFRLGGTPIGATVALALLVLGSAVTLLLAGRAVGPEGHGDPGWVVTDEVAGQSLALLPLAWVGHGAGAACVGFLLFRLLDVTKPPPVGALERLPGGVGVLADDLAAGLVTALAVWGAAALGWLDRLPI